MALTLATEPSAAQPPAQKGKPKAKEENTPAVADAAGIAPGVIERVKPSVAYIKGKRGSGSGFFVTPNVVATNSHVLFNEMIDDVKVRFISKAGAEQANITPQLLYENKARDIALLLVSRQTEREPLPMSAKFEPGPDRAVFVVGNPSQGNGIQRVNAVGTGVAEDTIVSDGATFLQLKVVSGRDAIDVGSGTSGGPVLCPAGEVVGILTAGMMDRKTGKPTGKFFCVPTAALREAVGGLSKPDAWDAAARKAAARHALDIAVVNTHLAGKVSAFFLEERADLGKNRFGYNARRDAEYIDIAKEFDKRLAESAAPALRLVYADSSLAAWRKDFTEMQSALWQARDITLQRAFSANKYKHAQAYLDKAEVAFRRLKADLGLPDSVIDLMLKSELASAAARIRR